MVNGNGLIMCQTAVCLKSNHLEETTVVIAGNISDFTSRP